MAEEASRSARQKGNGKREEGYGPGAGKGKARAPSQGRNKGKAQTKGGGKAKGHAQGSGKGSPPTPSAVQLDPLLEAAYQLYLQGRSHNQSRVSRNAWLRNNLRNNSEVRTQLRQRMEAAQGALRSERSAPSQPSGKGESASATPHRQPPTPPKAPPRDQQGRKLEPRHSNAEEAEAARGGGPPSPTGDSCTSPPLRQRRRETPLGRERATTRATSRPCQRLRLPSPLFPWVAWRRQPWKLTQSHPRPMVAVRRHLPTRPALSVPRGSGHHTSNRSAILPSGRPRPSSFFRYSCPGPGAGCHAS